MRIVAPLLIIMALVASPLHAAKEPKSDEDKTFYALGIALSRNLAAFGLTEEELEFVTLGLTDAVLKREPRVEYDDFASKIQELARTRAQATAAEEKKAAGGFLTEAASEPGAIQKASGLIYKEIEAGSGKTPTKSDKVKVHYEGTLRDGTVFDSSRKRGQPATFPLGGVIPCWTEGLQLMKVGGKAKLTCPASIAYGDRGAPPLIKPGAPLVFNVELLEIVE